MNRSSVSRLRNPHPRSAPFDKTPNEAGTCPDMPKASRVSGEGLSRFESRLPGS